ncbi:MAG: hypothetical protein ABIK89_15990, partial [Planctomycetota bacterium]
MLSQPFRERHSIGTASILSPGFMALLVISTAAHAPGQAAASDDERRPHPRLVTADTRADPQAIAALEKPGKVFFHDDFESPESVK